MSSQNIPRPIRTFARRMGHITPGQERALSQDWPHFRLNARDAPFDWSTLFGRDAPRILEIGFGMGDVLLAAAIENPQQDYIGIEVHPPGVGRCLLGAHSAGLNNIKICQEDAMQVLSLIPMHSVDEVWLYFPDPWPKTRHQKRRIVQPPFVEQIARLLKVGGRFRLATDWEHYAEQMMSVLTQSLAFRNHYGEGQFVPCSDVTRPKTKFERRGERLGHGIWDLNFTRVSS